ncbi:uncharacterized protein LOC108674808 [Hyalella azteca]|uniref:Uncharacterized protein LOC108674808 n=1 Tax=Hyalella azteca TaxID=294128 RepID=A0A8B7NX25_HYAAZ|nr:uncharacterized protein LOC108674808 [Hyalella azteca]
MFVRLTSLSLTLPIVLLAALLTVTGQCSPLGTVDWRYPDPAVQASLPCSTSGIFAHPVFCNWFYRCFDLHGHGHFNKVYFMCNPGSEFNQTSEACVPHGQRTSCIYYNSRLWPQFNISQSTGFSPALPVSTLPSTGTETGPGSQIASHDEGYQDQCYISENSCQTKLICPPVSEPRIHQAFVTKACLGASRTCSGITSPACPVGSFWDGVELACLPMSYLCDDPTPPPPLPDASQVQIECEARLAGTPQECHDAITCPLEGGALVLARSCRAPRRACQIRNDAGTRRDVTMCPFYDMLAQRCQYSPIESLSGCQKYNGNLRLSVSHCSHVKKICRVYTSCETGLKFVGCSHYYYCESALYRFNQAFQRQYCRHFNVPYAETPDVQTCLPYQVDPSQLGSGYELEQTTCISTGKSAMVRTETDLSHPQNVPISSPDQNINQTSINDLNFYYPFPNLTEVFNTDAQNNDHITLLADHQVFQQPIFSSNFDYHTQSAGLPSMSDRSRSQVSGMSFPDTKHRPGNEHFKPERNVTSPQFILYPPDSAVRNETSPKIKCRTAGEILTPKDEERLQCRNRHICDAAGNLLITVLGCQTYVECVDKAGRLMAHNRTCDQGLFYVLQEARCLGAHHYGGVPCDDSASPVPSGCQHEAQVVPLPPPLRALYCVTPPPCPGAPAIKQNESPVLCSSYHRCQRSNSQQTELSLVLESCPPPTMFSELIGECVNPFNSIDLICQ